MIDGYIVAYTRRRARSGEVIRALTYHPNRAIAADYSGLILRPEELIAGPVIVRQSELQGEDAREMARHRRAGETLCYYRPTAEAV